MIEKLPELPLTVLQSFLPTVRVLILKRGKFVTDFFYFEGECAEEGGGGCWRRMELVNLNYVFIDLSNVKVLFSKK